MALKSMVLFMLPLFSLTQASVVVTPTNASTSVGAKATISCQITTDITSPTYADQYFTYGTVTEEYSLKTHAGNATYKVAWDANILSLEIAKAPATYNVTSQSHENMFTCYVNISGTMYSAKPYITIFGVTMLPSYVIANTTVTVMCTIFGTTVEPSSIEFQVKGAETYTSESTDGNYTVSDGEAGDPRHVTLVINRPIVSATMEKVYTCSVNLTNIVYPATANMTIMSYVTSPLNPANTVEGVNSSITCMPPTIPYGSSAKWFKNNMPVGSETTVAASSSLTLTKTFTGNATETGTYYCNSSYPSSAETGFAGGNLLSEKSIFTVIIMSGDSKYCVIRNCTVDVVPESCFGDFNEKTCVYDMSKMQLKTIYCASSKGCAGTSAGAKHLWFHGIGAGSSLDSSADYNVTHFVNGTKAKITSATASSSNFEAACPGVTQAADNCSISTTKGTMTASKCTGPWCTVMIVECDIKTSASCYGASCLVKDLYSNYTISQCTGNNCTVSMNGGFEGSAYCNNLGCQVLITNSTTLSTVYANGAWSFINVTDVNQTKPYCQGDHCISYAKEGVYTMPECSGFACTAHGKTITNTGTNNIKVKCTGRDCTAICETSENCTAWCDGPFCKAICANSTTGVCQATCNGTYCSAECTGDFESNNCKTLTLPKRSPCLNCLVVPQMWNWSTCGPLYPKCQTCYAAQYDLLGITLYRQGCDDNKTLTDPPCVNNTYIQACYVDYCSNDYCTSTLLKKYLNATAASLVPTLKVLVGTLFCHPLINTIILSSLFSYVDSVLSLIWASEGK